MNARRINWKRGLASGLAAICGAAWSQGAAADAVTDWNANIGGVAMAACISPAPNPFHESRLYGMVHVAVHDALNAIQRRSQPYAYDAIAPAGASPAAAVAAAAYSVLASEVPKLPAAFFGPCIPGAMQLAGQQYAAALAAIPDGQAKADGIAVGQAAADAIVAMRANDGSDTPFADFAYKEGKAPGEWRFTDGAPFAAAPGWGSVTPFVLERADQFRPQPPYPVSCDSHSAKTYTGSCALYARDFEDIKNYGGTGASLRTPDETQIGMFWVESSPLAWNRITRSVSPGFGYDLWDNARLFALLNMGMADGYVASLSTKYHYNYWRPETAVRLADSDGNPSTSGDPTWTPLAAPTPPVPDYESAHAVEGATAAEVLRRVFGTDQVKFDNCSLTLPDPTQRCGGANEVRREYSTFSQAAAENGRSRVLCGYHFQNAVDKGLQHGRRIGAEAVKRYMQPTS
jgi:hypothetical protein